MKKIVCFLLTGMLMFTMAGVQVTEAAEIKTPSYSNLVDSQSQKEVKKALHKAGIPETTVNAWLNDVTNYNKTVRNTSLVKKGFKKMTKNPVYNENRISSLWNKKYKRFIGYDCRITAFDLIKKAISVDNTNLVNPANLFMDEDALNNAPEKKFTRKQIKAFESVFSTVKTSYTPDVSVHEDNWLNDWGSKGIKFSDNTKASLISVVMHSSFSEDDNELFVGHAGVLVPKGDGQFYFIEKLSFTLPYQATKFSSRKQLYDYLMSMYDTEWGQGTAKPFVMEDGQIIKY